MHFKLIQETYPNYSALEQVLTNRGIPLNEIKGYLNTTSEDVNSCYLLGKNLLFDAATALAQCITLNQKALIIVDSDCDGFTSSALLINYLYKLFPAWVTNCLSWFIHDGKQHGLSDVDIDNLEEETKLIILPDAGSNDYEYHKKLFDMGKTVIVLDHHEAEKISEHAIIINNQLSEYPNKDMSGVGVTWQFCRYLDGLFNKDYSNDYLDLVALGMDADMMSMLSKETKHLILEGFKNIRNPFFEAMIEKNSYSMKNKVTPMSVAFYVAPFVNAIVRSGTLEEKEIVFRSFLEFKAYEKILSNKRGHKPGEMEYTYIQAIRTATNVKARQTRAQDMGMALLEKKILNENLLDHKVLLFLLEPGEIDRNIAGLVANKLMAKYQRPCCVLTKVIEKKPFIVEEPGNHCEGFKTKISYQGSARGYDKSGVTNFKELCEAAPGVMYAEGHQSAFGLGIKWGYEEEEFGAEVNGDLLIQFIDHMDKVLENMPNEPTYYVDYLYDGINVDDEKIVDIAQFDYLWGKDIDEPFIAIKNLKVTQDMLTLMSPDKKPTLKITLPNKTSLIKFNSSQEEYDTLLSEGYVEINLVGRCNANKWMGNVTPQILIEEYEIIDRTKYIF